MSQYEKLILKLRITRGDVRYLDIESLLNHLGYVNVRQRGSHAHFRKEDSPNINFPIHRGKVKVVYIHEIYKILSL